MDKKPMRIVVPILAMGFALISCGQVEQISSVSFQRYDSSGRPIYDFAEVYPWANGLKAEDIELVSCVGDGSDIGPGALYTYCHGDTDADKQMIVDFATDNLLTEDPLYFVCGGYPRHYTVQIGGNSYEFWTNAKCLDGKYATTKYLNKNPSVIDYYRFVEWNFGLDILDEDGNVVRTLPDMQFFKDIDFIECEYESEPALTGCRFDIRGGVWFIDAKHFKCYDDYYEIISDADFGDYING